MKGVMDKPFHEEGKGDHGGDHDQFDKVAHDNNISHTMDNAIKSEEAKPNGIEKLTHHRSKEKGNEKREFFSKEGKEFHVEFLHDEGADKRGHHDSWRVSKNHRKGLMHHIILRGEVAEVKLPHDEDKKEEEEDDEKGSVGRFFSKIGLEEVHCKNAPNRIDL